MLAYCVVHCALLILILHVAQLNHRIRCIGAYSCAAVRAVVMLQLLWCCCVSCAVCCVLLCGVFLNFIGFPHTESGIYLHI